MHCMQDKNASTHTHTDQRGGGERDCMYGPQHFIQGLSAYIRNASLHFAFTFTSLSLSLSDSLASFRFDCTDR